MSAHSSDHARPADSGPSPETLADARLSSQELPDRPTPVQSRSRAVQLENKHRWWLRMCLQPVLILLSITLGIAGLGWAQRMGWISVADLGGSSGSSLLSEAVEYICPMMCTAPQKQPGRCPVCAMELVQAASGGEASGDESIRIDPAARRIANIKTVSVRSANLTRTIKAVGKLNYDEGSLRTIAAWVPGRLDKLYADYTGVFVNKGDHLALVYSPELYSGQVELLLARQAKDAKPRQGRSRVVFSDAEIYDSARERLLELGLTDEQIAEIERQGKASSRMHLCAPISGTVIEKRATEGEYVSEGQAIYKLADLSTVWLMLELFPEDAAAIRYGQESEATVQSLPGRKFSGRVAFINPHVDENTRTVGVRVVIPNPDGLLRVGDFANAEISVPIENLNVSTSQIYDPELASKWISPRHPHIVADAPGNCPVCGINLVPAARFGYSDQPLAASEVMSVPRSAVLTAGQHSVIYVEVSSGRFELRQLTLGPQLGDDVVVLDGLEPDERVAASGSFLIDSQMQLAGKPSLIDPDRLKAAPSPDLDPAVRWALSELSDEERTLAIAQRICPVTDLQLGSMGVPPQVEVRGEVIYICCEGCRDSLMGNPDKYIARLADARQASSHQAVSAEPELPSMGTMQLVPSPDTVPPLGKMQLLPQDGIQVEEQR